MPKLRSLYAPLFKLQVNNFPLECSALVWKLVNLTSTLPTHCTAESEGLISLNILYSFTAATGVQNDPSTGRPPQLSTGQRPVWRKRIIEYAKLEGRNRDSVKRLLSSLESEDMDEREGTNYPIIYICTL